jgi:2-oxoisovalerate dehydrogenase E1 component
MGLEKFENLILMGQDIAEYGGAFKVTEGLAEKFGKDRIRNTPLCESAIVGIGLGLSISGFKSVIEMQFADFVSCAFNQIVNNLAKSHYRWGQHSDVVIRMPTGAGSGAGPFHSQSTEAWFFHVPGLKIVYPSNPEDAKGLIIAAIEDPNPVLYFEHKFLYRTLKGMVPENYFSIPIGQGKIETEGKKLTVVTYGLGVHWVKELLPQFEGNTIELIDLRSLLPWDKNLVVESVKKTNKVLIVHEDTLTGGIGAEIAAYISEHCFKFLDAPVKRIASEDTPVPFNKLLESNFLPMGRLKKAMDEMLQY